MNARTAAWLAWSLAGLSLLIVAASIVLGSLSLFVGADQSLSIVGGLLFLVSFSAFPIVGALISSRHPRNPIGWICLADGILWMLMVMSQEYGVYGLAKPDSVPFPVTINALLYAWLWVPAVGLLGTYLLLLFPDGRLPSKKWRPLTWLSGVVISSVSVLTFLTPGPLDGLGGARNPFGLEGHPWVTAAGNAVLPLLLLCMFVSALSLVLRYRRSGGEVREQIKWIAFAASFMGVLYLGIMSAGTVIWLVSAPQTPTDLGAQDWWGPLLENVMVLSFAGVPIAIGFAVLKHRLYDIDIIVNRTLVYGSLTVSLGLMYLGSVVLLQGIFRALTGQNSQLAVVASTLAIAALFGPLRRRIQDIIDRRFYRRKYDAANTLEAFGARLRNETDLDTLGEDLLAVTRETLQPAHVSLWLRGPERESRDLGVKP